jgi:hypothetical protein
MSSALTLSRIALAKMSSLMSSAVYVPLIRKLRFVSSGFWFRRRAYRVPEMLNDHAALQGLQVVTITKTSYQQDADS